MPRTRNAPATNKRRKKVLKRARGYFGNKSRLFRYAQDAVRRSDQFAYAHRRKKKSVMRRLWIVRINAAVRSHEMSYSRFMAGINAAGIELDRKAISEMAIHDEAAFTALVEKAKSSLTTAA